MHGTENDNYIFLNMLFRKADGATEGFGYTDEDGNYIFELEASNENVDLQGQIVLQRALLESEDFFLRNGVISNDHQHRRKDENGNMIVDNRMVIGEPISVRKDGKSTIVKGKLYGNVKAAEPFIELLKAKSNRVRGSVGGIFPKVEKDASGAEKITSVLWNDLALTCSPVNHSVGYAVFAKSMNQAEILKALEAGYNTDSATKENGSALVPENVGTGTLKGTETISYEEKEILRSLLAALQTGEIAGQEQAENFLIEKGFDTEKSRASVREIIEQGGLMKLSEKLHLMLKSITGNGDGSGDGEKPKGGNTNGSDNGNGTGNGSGEGNNGAGNGNSTGNGSGEGNNGAGNGSGNDDDDIVVDGEELIKSLATENEALHKSLGELQQQFADMSEGMLAIGEMVKAIADQKQPMRSVMSKSLGAEKNAVPEGRVFDESDFEKVQSVLRKSVDDGEIDLVKSSIMSREFQRQMATGVQMSKSTWDFLSDKILGGK